MSYINQVIILQCSPPSSTLPKKAVLSPSVCARREYLKTQLKVALRLELTDIF